MRKITIRGEEYWEEEKPISFHIDYYLGVEAPTAEDEVERDYLFALLDRYCFLYMDDDLNTRRVVLQPKYDGNQELASCMSMIQFLVRDNIVNCYCTMRSEINTTHDWDCDTLFLLTRRVYEKYNLKSFDIYMTVNSYHRKLTN